MTDVEGERGRERERGGEGGREGGREGEREGGGREREGWRERGREIVLNTETCTLFPSQSCCNSHRATVSVAQ